MDFIAGLSPMDREAVLHAVVSGGGAMLVAYAGYVRATERATPAQVRALASAGVGFLMSAGASAYLRDRGPAGVAVSLAGCAVVLASTRTLLRERLERQHEQRRRAAHPPGGE